MTAGGADCDAIEPGREEASGAPGGDVSVSVVLLSAFSVSGPDVAAEASRASRPDRSVAGLDYEEFEELLHTVATVADEWDDKLISQFGEG